MTATVCPHCGAQSARPGDMPTAWCRTCGGTLQPALVDTPAPTESLVSLTPVPATPRRWGRQKSPRRPVDSLAPRSSRLPRDPATDAEQRADIDRMIEAQVAREVGVQPPAWWCYGFAGLCALIPLVAMGGAAPAVIGLSGASACAKIAHSHNLSGLTKTLACLAVTAFCWMLFIALLVVAFKVKQGLAPRR